MSLNQTLIGGHIVARQLAAEGTDCVFTLCGGHIAPIYDGCLRENIRIVDTRHEQAAVHAADGYARLSRNVGVAILTAGPGVTDGVTGVANAYQAQVPIVVLGGAAELRFTGKGALQEMEQTGLILGANFALSPAAELAADWSPDVPIMVFMFGTILKPSDINVLFEIRKLNRKFINPLELKHFEKLG